jgi:two-component system sensor kinase FixL
MDINAQEQGVFQALLEALPDAIVITDSAGAILLVNAQTEQLFGYHREELINKPVELLIPERFRAIHSRHRSTYSSHPRMRSMGAGLQLLGRRKDGESFPVEISLSPLETRAGLFVSSAIRDISMRKQADAAPARQAAKLQRDASPLDLSHELAVGAILEAPGVLAASTLTSQVAQLEEQQHTMAEQLTAAEAAVLQGARLAAVGKLAASLAHEITNPLYAVRSCLHLLAEDLPVPLRDSQYLSIARDQLTRIAGVIERMHHFYRPEQAEMAPQDLNSLLEETLTLARLQVRYTAIAVSFEPAANLPLVLCNGDQLRQVLLNLIFNGIDAMPDGGTLTVRTLAGPEAVTVEVQDTGAGISEETRARLFDAFFTTKPSGTGLGLSICAHIVAQHGGHIDVESTPGQGSIFRVILPFASGL